MFVLPRMNASCFNPTSLIHSGLLYLGAPQSHTLTPARVQYLYGESEYRAWNNILKEILTQYIGFRFCEEVI